MAGKNIILEPNQVLFRAGDTSDGMYIIRQGELRVYLEEDGKEVTLATVASGGMIGEMALFDKKPRSASVKASKKTEVTLISNEDFGKLMKQIPKWFVSLMGTLSTRLRETNERLQKVSIGTKVPFENTLRILHVFSMIWHKDGSKEGKTWQLEKSTAAEAIKLMFHEDAAKFDDLVQVLVKHNIFETQKNSYNAVVLTMMSKGTLGKFVEFFDGFLTKNKANPLLGRAGIDILKTLSNYASKSAYDTFSVDIDELQKYGNGIGIEDTSGWKAALPLFKSLGDYVQLVKTSNNNIGFKVSKKDLDKAYSYHAIIHDLHDSGLS